MVNVHISVSFRDITLQFVQFSTLFRPRRYTYLFVIKYIWNDVYGKYKFIRMLLFKQFKCLKLAIKKVKFSKNSLFQIQISNEIHTVSCRKKSEVPIHIQWWSKESINFL